MGVLFVLMAGVGLAPADEPAPEVVVVNRAMERAAAHVTPSIACILVSRSDAYQRLFAEPAPPQPGQLGTFDPGRAGFHWPPDDHPEIAALTRQLRGKARFADETTRRAELLRILRQRYDLSDPGYVPASYGSGVVIDRDGLVLTYFHVVRDATKLYVRLAGKKGSYADIYAADPISDLAVLRILDRSILPLTPIARGDGGSLQKGQLVLTMANPFAAGSRDAVPTTSWGTVSAIRHRTPTRPITDDWEQRDLNFYRYGTLVQTDARLHVGCSGGALLHLDGKLVGLTTALGGTSGIETSGTVAVPLDANKWHVVDVLARGDEVEHGFLGITFDPRRWGRFRRRANNNGEVMVWWVLGNSPAARAGLQSGDVILAINDQPVPTVEDARRAIGELLAGSEAHLKVRSAGGKEQTVTATLTKSYQVTKGIAAHRPPFAHGLRVDFTSVLSQRFGAGGNRIPDGVVVSEVAPHSPPDLSKLQDSRITEVNGNPVNTPAEFYAALRQSDREGQPIQLTVVGPERSAEPHSVTLP